MTGDGQPVWLAPAVAPCRVVLVRPPVVVFPRSLSAVGPTPPVGLAYVAAALRQAGHHVDVVDGVGAGLDRAHDFDSPIGTLRRLGLSPEEIVAQIDPSTAVVGISNMFLHEWPQARAIAELARQRAPGATIVIGGDNATAFWRWAFAETDAIDVCVLGEGEATMVEVVDRLSTGTSLAGLHGVALRAALDESSEAPQLPTRLRHVDDVPRPAWDLFPVEAYLARPDFLGVNRGRSMPILGTRGCPYRCTFCSSPQMWTTRYVVRDPADVVDEIEHYVATYDIDNIDFVDLTAATKRSWVLALCDAMDARDLRISWQLPVGTRSEALDEEVLRRLWETGCRNITYAPESGSPRMLEVMQKRVDLDRLLDSLRAAHKIGLTTHANVIIGHPAERWSDLWRTARLLARLALIGCDTASAIMFSAYPGSVDFDDLLATGRVTMDERAYYAALSRGSSAHVSYNPRMSGRALRIAQMVVMLMFYGLGTLSHPRRLLRMWRSQRTGEERTHLDQLIRIKRRGYSGEAPDHGRRGHPAPAGVPAS